MEYFDVSATTDAAGAATVYSESFTGRIECVQYLKTDFDNGSTFAVTTEDTLQTVWSESNVNASAIRALRQAAHLNTSGAAIAASYVPICVFQERIKFAITSGGNAKTGAFRVWFTPE